MGCSQRSLILPTCKTAVPLLLPHFWAKEKTWQIILLGYRIIYFISYLFNQCYFLWSFLLVPHRHVKQERTTVFNAAVFIAAYHSVPTSFSRLFSLLFRKVIWKLLYSIIMKNHRSSWMFEFFMSKLINIWWRN